MNTVYMINPNTGEKIPISHISNCDITCDTESTDMSDIKDLITLKDCACTLQTTITNLSETLRKLLYPKELTNNYRRLHGGRAIRWRKLK